MTTTPFAERYLAEARRVIDQIDVASIEAVVQFLVQLRERQGRLFVIGSGGGAGHASHAVGDFRKIAGIEAYAPSDNTSELTARINDDGWESSIAGCLKSSRLGRQDGILVFSVGGGDVERNISINLVRAMEYAQEVGAPICAVVGRDGGYAAKVSTACVVVPTVSADTVTAHTEAFQAVVWHLLVSHPDLQLHGMKWESSV